MDLLRDMRWSRSCSKEKKFILPNISKKKLNNKVDVTLRFSRRLLPTSDISIHYDFRGRREVLLAFAWKRLSCALVGTEVAAIVSESWSLAERVPIFVIESLWVDQEIHGKYACQSLL